MQGTLLGLVGLLLAFGLTMAVGRYEARRALVVQEANTIGTTYLRAQLLPEPPRTTSLELLKEYNDLAIVLADQVPFTDGFDATAAAFDPLQRELWAATGEAVDADPTGTGPRTYVETMNEMIDTHTERMASLRNRVPTPVMLLLVVGSGLALGMLAAYLAILGRSIITSLIAATVVIVILFVSFDLDRPQRGFITVPFTPLVETRADDGRSTRRGRMTASGVEPGEHGEDSAMVVGRLQEVELRQDARDVGLDRLLVEHELPRDRRVGASLRHEAEHLAFSRGEPAESVLRLMLPEQRADDVRVEDGAPFGHRGQRVDQRRHVQHVILEQVAEPSWMGAGEHRRASHLECL